MQSGKENDILPVAPHREDKYLYSDYYLVKRAKNNLSGTKPILG